MNVHPSIDDVDRQIIALLRDDARRSFQDIGSRVALSAPAVKRRVDRLRRDGVIRGFTTLIDPGRFGWHAMAVVELTTEGRFSADDVKTAVSGHPEVAAPYTVAGQATAVPPGRAPGTPHPQEGGGRPPQTP